MNKSDKKCMKFWPSKNYKNSWKMFSSIKDFTEEELNQKYKNSLNTKEHIINWKVVYF